MSDRIKAKALQGVAWKFAEKIGTQAAQFVIQIILARMLLPEEYGLVGLLTIFITISDIFVQQSFTAALIQRKDADEKDFSAVLLINVLSSVVIYSVLYFTAPWVADFYHNAELIPLMRVLSINVMIGSFGAVPNAILSRYLDFKKSFFRSLCNVSVQGIVGIWCAYAGFGSWALVYSKLFGTLVGTVVLCLTVRWKFILEISVERLRQLFSFGLKVMTNNLINTIFNNINSLVIGRYYPNADLGFYQRGQQIPQAIMNAVDGSMNEVLFPTLSGVQSDPERLKRVLRKSMSISVYLVFPLMLGLAAVAEPLTLLLLTEKWLPCVPYLRLQCILCMFWPLSARTHALNAIGRSDVTLKISVITRSIALLAIFVCLRQGIFTIMVGMILVSVFSVMISTYYVKEWIHYSYMELMKDILPPLLLSGGMAFVVWGIGKWMEPDKLLVFFQIFAGIVIYLVGSIIVRNESLFYLLDCIKKVMVRKKNSSDE